MRGSIVLAGFVSLAIATPPKVILHITVDDLGWHNVDWHRAPNDPEVCPRCAEPEKVLGELTLYCLLQRATPNMLALASDGIILDGLYGFRMCTPSRTSFLSVRRIGRFVVAFCTRANSCIDLAGALPGPCEPGARQPRSESGLQ